MLFGIGHKSKFITRWGGTGYKREHCLFGSSREQCHMIRDPTLKLRTAYLGFEHVTSRMWGLNDTSYMLHYCVYPKRRIESFYFKCVSTKNRNNFSSFLHNFKPTPCKSNGRFDSPMNKNICRKVKWGVHCFGETESRGDSPFRKRRRKFIVEFSESEMCDNERSNLTLGGTVTSSLDWSAVSSTLVVLRAARLMYLESHFVSKQWSLHVTDIFIR